MPKRINERFWWQICSKQFSCICPLNWFNEEKEEIFTIIYFKGINKLFRFFQSIVKSSNSSHWKTLNGLWFYFNYGLFFPWLSPMIHNYIMYTHLAQLTKLVIWTCMYNNRNSNTAIIPIFRNPFHKSRVFNLNSSSFGTDDYPSSSSSSSLALRPDLKLLYVVNQNNFDTVCPWRNFPEQLEERF